MTRWRSLTALVLSAGALLAGCVQAEPRDGVDDCEAWGRSWCEPGDPRACPACACPLGADCGACARCSAAPPARPPQCCAPPPPPPPLLGAFDAARVAACEGCAEVALAPRAGEAVLASARGLHVAGAGGATREVALELPPLVGRARTQVVSPDAHVGEDGTVWYAALARDALHEGAGAAAPARLVLGAWSGGEGWDALRVLDAHLAPPLALAERVWVLEARGALVVVLASDDAGWAMRSFDRGATFPQIESLTPPGGRAAFGAPARDPAGRLLVPFAFAAWSLVPGLVAQTGAPMALHYAALGDGDGAWTLHGGLHIPQGIAPHARPALAAGAGSATFLWVDAARSLAWIDAWDDGGGWGAPAAFADAASRASGDPAAARLDTRASVAWWQQDGALVVGRTEGGPRPERATLATQDAPSARPALALDEEGRALVAWSDGADLWLARERPR